MQKVVQIADFMLGKFSQADEYGAKISSQSDAAKMPESPAKAGFAANTCPPSKGNSGGNLIPSKSATKTKAALHAKAGPSVQPTPGPKGYMADCAVMTATHLRLAYPGEYTSWKDGKSRCKQKGWPWAVEWEKFSDFLLSMGPKPTPQHTLDRIDNSLGAYGPTLCKWSSKFEQNNNKSDNIKIVLPLTGTEFSAKKLAALHKVDVKTVYKWKAIGYSDLEMIAGKKSSHLAALSEALPKSPVSTSSKSTSPRMRVPPYSAPTFPDEPEPTADEIEEYDCTGVMKFTSTHDIYRREYNAVAAWVDGVDFR